MLLPLLYYCRLMRLSTRSMERSSHGANHHNLSIRFIWITILITGPMIMKDSSISKGIDTNAINHNSDTHQPLQNMTIDHNNHKPDTHSIQEHNMNAPMDHSSMSH